MSASFKPKPPLYTEPGAKSPRRYKLLAADDPVWLAFFQLFFPLALRIVGHHQDAEDAAQEAALQAWRCRNTFRGDSKLETWLHTIVRNRSVRVWHQTTRRRQREVPLADYDAPAKGPVLDQADVLDIREAVAVLVDELKSVAWLVAEGNTREEAAALLCVPSSTVQSRWRTALSDLRDAFGGYLKR